METSIEEIRIRALVANRTGNIEILKNIPVNIQVAGMYPDIIGQGMDEFNAPGFMDKIKAWPDVEQAVIEYKKTSKDIDAVNMFVNILNDSIMETENSKTMSINRNGLSDEENILKDASGIVDPRNFEDANPIKEEPKEFDIRKHKDFKSFYDSTQKLL